MLTARPGKFISEEYLIVFLGAMQALAYDREIGLEAHRILNYLVSIVLMRNEWNVLNQADVGKQLGIKRPNVARALSLLVRKGIIVKGARIGRGHAYSLNPSYGWRGPVGELGKAKEEAPKLRLVHSAGSVAA